MPYSMPGLSGFSSLRGRVFAGNVPLGRAAAQPMLVEATGRFAATVQAGDHLAKHVHYLALRVDPEASARVVDERRGPGGVEWRRPDFIPGHGLAEIHITTGVHKAPGSILGVYCAVIPTTLPGLVPAESALMRLVIL